MALTEEYPHIVLIPWLKFSKEYFDIEDWLSENIHGGHARMPTTIDDRTFVRFMLEHEDEATAFALKWL